MDISIDALASNLLAPTILFFILGLLASIARSDLSAAPGSVSRACFPMLHRMAPRSHMTVASLTYTESGPVAGSAGAR